MNMIKLSRAEIAGLIDLVGASLFAFGIAASVSAAAHGAWPPVSALIEINSGGLIRGAAAFAGHGHAIAAAQRIARVRRSGLVRALLGTPLASAPPSAGAAAVLALDHSRAIEAYQARFVPARFTAVAAPLLVVLITACASLVAAAILLATLVPFAAGMILAGSLARRASDRQLAALAALSELFVDRLRMLPIIRHFAAGDRIARQVAEASDRLAQRTVAVLRAAFLSIGVLEFFSALAVALVAVYCGFSLLGLLPFPDPETLTLREAFFALAMAPEFYLPMRRLAAAYHEKQLGDAAEAAIAALPEPMPARTAQRFAGLAIEGLCIAWPGQAIGPVTAAFGMRGLVAVTGATGSGKTSLLAAIAGQVAPVAGAVTALRPGDIAWAAQQPLILPGTLADNLRLGAPDADDAALLAAIEAVGLGSLAAARGGLSLLLDHRGSGLSGGERRRLGLARALLTHRPLLLVDEPTADLDAASAATIVALLQSAARDRLVIAATHDARIGAVADARIGL